jgi:hypothetical protein
VTSAVRTDSPTAFPVARPVESICSTSGAELDQRTSVTGRLDPPDRCTIARYWTDVPGWTDSGPSTETQPDRGVGLAGEQAAPSKKRTTDTKTAGAVRVDIGIP